MCCAAWPRKLVERLGGVAEHLAGVRRRRPAARGAGLSRSASGWQAYNVDRRWTCTGRSQPPTCGATGGRFHARRPDCSRSRPASAFSQPDELSESGRRRLRRPPGVPQGRGRRRATAPTRSTDYVRHGWGPARGFSRARRASPARCIGAQAARRRGAADDAGSGQSTSRPSRSRSPRRRAPTPSGWPRTSSPQAEELQRDDRPRRHRSWSSPATPA